MKKRVPRPLLRTATLTVGSLLVGCGSSQSPTPATTDSPPEPIPMPGNPKGAHYNMTVSGTVVSPPENIPDGAMLHIAVRSESDQILASQTLPAATFPVAFSIEERTLNALPDTVHILVRLDNDGDPSTSSPDEPSVQRTVSLAASTGLVIPLDDPPLSMPGNPKGSHYNEPQPPLPSPATDE